MIFDLAFKRVRHLFEPQHLFPIVYLSRVEWHLDASTSVYEFDNVVRGQRVYKSAWTPLTDKTCKYILWEDNEHDKYAVNDPLKQHPEGGCTHQERY